MLHRHVARFAILAAFALLPAAAQAVTLEERIQALESQLDQVVRENAALRGQVGADRSAPAVKVTAAGRETRLAVGGFVQAQAEFGDAPDARFPAQDRFFLRRTHLEVAGAFGSDFEFVAQAELAGGSLGATSGNRVSAADVFVVWHAHEQANLTLGQFKAPFGREFLLPDTGTVALERSLVSDQLVAGGQLGAMLSVGAAGGRVTYAAGLFNGNGGNTSTNDNDRFLCAGRLTALLAQTTAASLAVGANAYTTDDTGAFTGRRQAIGFDAAVTYGVWGLDAEYLRVRRSPSAQPAATADGWAVLGSVFIVPGTLQAIARCETFDPLRSAVSDDTRLWTLGFNYLLKGQDLRFSVNYLFGETAGAKQDRLLVRTQVIF